MKQLISFPKVSFVAVFSFYMFVTSSWITLKTQTQNLYKGSTLLGQLFCGSSLLFILPAVNIPTLLPPLSLERPHSVPLPSPWTHCNDVGSGQQAGHVVGPHSRRDGADSGYQHHSGNPGMPQKSVSPGKNSLVLPFRWAACTRACCLDRVREMSRGQSCSCSRHSFSAGWPCHSHSWSLLLPVTLSSGHQCRLLGCSGLWPPVHPSLMPCSPIHTCPSPSSACLSHL